VLGADHVHGGAHEVIVEGRQALQLLKMMSVAYSICMRLQ
jgi:hypothetical protein